jgi:thiol:disulfide interchange protein
MKPAHRPFAAVFVVFASVMAVVGVSRWMTPKEIIPWRRDFEAARAEAKASHKPVFAYFTADWCGPCHTLKTTTWADRRVEEALRAYVPARVDVMIQTAVATEYGADMLPKFAVLDDGGNVVKTIDGYMDADEFLTWLKDPTTAPATAPAAVPATQP